MSAPQPNKPSVVKPKPIARLKTTKPSTPSGDVSSIAPNIQSVKSKKEFKPNIPTARKKKDERDPLSGTITDLLSQSLQPLSVGERAPSKPSQSAAGKFRPNFNPNRKRPATMPITNLFHTPLVQADIQQQSSYETNKKNDKKNSELLAQLFHEMEVDPMQPFHPTHLPLVDPRKIMKAYSLDDASKDLTEKKRDLELRIANGELSDTTNFDLNNLNSNNEDISGKKKDMNQQDKPFYIEDQFLDKDKLFFFQLPNSLPTTKSRPQYNAATLFQPPPPTKPTVPPVAKGGAAATPAVVVDAEPPKQELTKKSFVPMIYPGDFPPTLKEIPEGKLGTLKIYKSGKTVLKIGTVEYDVSAGDKLKFLEEVKCFTKDGPDGQPTCFTLGTPSQHLVAAPVISLIN